MPKISRNDTMMSNNIELPTQTYRVRVVGTEASVSKKGNTMTKLSIEIVEPENVTINGEEQKVSGETGLLYLVHNPALVGAQRQSSQSQVFEFMERLGILDMCELDEYNEPVYDTDKHKDYFLGMTFDMILGSKPRVKFANGKPVLDSEGKEIVDGFMIDANLSNVLPNCRPERADLPF